MAVGSTCQFIKNKNKEKRKKKYFYGMIGAKIFFYNLKYLIFMKNIILENTYIWSVCRCKFSAKNSFYFGL
jgi:hypothetical protein